MRAREVIATHAAADFDAYASMLAARRLYPQAVVCLPSTLDRNVRELHRLLADEIGAVEVARIEARAVRRLVIVDTVHADRLDEKLQPLALDPKVEKVVFDHHGDPAPAWADPQLVVVSTDGALTTTLVGILAGRGVAVTPYEATAFALGIHEDTGSLTFPGSTERDAEALGWCMRHAARQDLVARFLRSPLGADEVALFEALLEGLRPVRTHGIDVLVAALAWPGYVEGVANLAHKLIDVTDAAALALLVEMDGRTVCVTRSRVPEVDASALAAALGGGGHASAASGIARVPVAEARARLVAALPGAVQPSPQARDVMSSPARSVAPEDTVAAAMALCQRHGQSGVLVVHEGRLDGVVGREDLDKAIGHGLSRAPVKAVMNTAAPTCGEETPLPELQRLLSSSGAGRVAVLRGGRVVGVVARVDVLRGLGKAASTGRRPGDDAVESRPAAADDGGESIAAELERLDRVRPLFEAVQAASEHTGGVYLVGGTVRDILLGEPGFDVDIAVEGDAVAFARSLGKVLRARVRTHDKFGTAVVSWGDGERLDVVTARSEFYDAPGALPTVEHASIRDDLFRRDFTINAMAASLRGEDFGRLVDPFGGRRDIAARTIRVLHNLSFIDDPTRIFRAVRYESRYGFSMDDRSERLARACVEMGLVHDLSGARVRTELIAILEDAHPGRGILRLGELGAATAIDPALAADADTVALLERLRALASALAPDVPAWRLGLAALARRLAPDEAYALSERLKIRRRDADAVAAAVGVAPRLARALRGRQEATPAEVVALVEPYPLDVALVALGLEELPALRDYLASWREVRLAVTGADLADLGLAESPAVGEVLAELRRRKLNGELDGREAEIAAARELIAAAVTATAAVGQTAAGHAPPGDAATVQP